MIKVKDDFKNGKHDIGWVDSEFIEKFGELEITEGKVCSYETLSNPMTFLEMKERLKPEIVSFGDVLETIKQGDLETTGWGNFFFVEHKGEVSVVYISRYDRRWFVRVRWLDLPFRWGAENRFFSRNFGHSEID